MLEYIRVTVEANAVEYHDHCKRVCLFKYGHALEKLPPNGEIVEDVVIRTNGLPHYVYVFFVLKK